MLIYFLYKIQQSLQQLFLLNNSAIRSYQFPLFKSVADFVSHIAFIYIISFIVICIRIN